MSNQAPIITLDGPGGAGKGTLAAQLAHELGWHLLDSGALYRLVALVAVRSGLQAQDTEDCNKAAQQARQLDVRFMPRDDGQSIELNGEDVTQAIRAEQVSAAASQWAAVPTIRQALLQRHWDFAQLPGLVGDGRDLGTVIFPNADLKLFVTASAEERARRRYDQLSARGIAANIDQIYRDIVERDERDASREVAPLKPADDAYLIDTTGDDVTASLQKIRELVVSKGWLN